MDKLVEYIAKALVEFPDQVEVRAISEREGEQLLELRVAAEDRGRVIGKNGRTAHAIRTLLTAASAPTGQNVQLEIVD